MSIRRRRRRILKASAGTGKTFALAHLVLRLLSEGEPPLQVEQLLVVTFTEAARVLAERVLSTQLAGNAARLERLFLLTLSRPPTAAESSILLDNLKHQRSAFTRAPQAAAKLAATGDTPRQPGLDDSAVATWTTLSSLLLNLDEAISRE